MLGCSDLGRCRQRRTVRLFKARLNRTEASGRVGPSAAESASSVWLGPDRGEKTPSSSDEDDEPGFPSQQPYPTERTMTTVPLSKVYKVAPARSPYLPGFYPVDYCLSCRASPCECGFEPEGGKT